MTITFTVRLGTRVVGRGRCLMIVEAGVNHNGRLDLTRKLIDAAVDCCADAIKFQAFNRDQVVTARAARAPYQRTAGTTSQREMLKRLVLPPWALEKLGAHAGRRGMLFLVTPFDLWSLRAVIEAGVPAIKLGSGEVTNLLLLPPACQSGLPLLLSTGMSMIDELDTAVSVCRRSGGRQLVLFHCVSAYQAPIGEMNVRALPAMASRYRVAVGLSDHSPAAAASAAAVALGAAAIEKRSDARQAASRTGSGRVPRSRRIPNVGEPPARRRSRARQRHQTVHAIGTSQPRARSPQLRGEGANLERDCSDSRPPRDEASGGRHSIKRAGPGARPVGPTEYSGERDPALDDARGLSGRRPERVGVPTTGRSDYGLLPFRNPVAGGPARSIRVRLFVTGMHLSARFGRTIRDIEADGYRRHIILRFLTTSSQTLSTLGRIVSVAQRFGDLAWLPSGTDLSREER